MAAPSVLATAAVAFDAVGRPERHDLFLETGFRGARSMMHPTQLGPAGPAAHTRSVRWHSYANGAEDHIKRAHEWLGAQGL
jgi:hypothetical protein